MQAAAPSLRVRASVLIALSVGTAASACTPSTSPSEGATCTSLDADVRDYIESGRVDDGRLDWTLDELSYRCEREYQTLVDEVAGSAQSHPDAADAPVEVNPAPWVCSYAPTMNDDWHDDVLCSNGQSEDRPYLREWDDFVTESEIMDSAAEYEHQLND